MPSSWQIPRAGLLWLLVAMAAIIAVHAPHLPPWTLGAAVVALWWRFQVDRGVWSYPGRWAKAALLILCGGGLVATYGNVFELEPMVALAVSGLVLKLLEMHRRRDALIVVFLGYFLAIVACLFAQTMMVAVVVLVCLALVTAALVGLHHQHRWLRNDWLQPLRTGAVLLLQALPLMLVLFLIMPRIGSLWAVPQPQQRAVTGVGDSMAPGGFTALGRSGAVAFRAAFAGSTPAQHALYWRGPVLSHFDGRRWTRAEADTRWRDFFAPGGEAADAIEHLGAPIDYEIVLEETNAHWLFALMAPAALGPDMGLTPAATLIRRTPVVGRSRYQVRSWLHYRLAAAELAPSQRALNLALPPGFNPQTRQIAEQWRLQTPEPRALIARVLDLFRREFIYTLTPPSLGTHSVDEFLWQTRRGFCEFYASSFVVFMRAAGIPARVVTGYQGGERHPGGYLLVHQYDAHAWAEVWLAGRGWVLVDPTAAVAPERIETTFADLFGEDAAFLGRSLFALERYRHWGLLNALRLRLDALDYAWSKWVLGYDSVQNDVLTGLLGGVDSLRIAAFLLVAGGLALIPVAVALRWARRRPRREPLEALFLACCERLARLGIVRATGEGPRSLAARVAVEKPHLAPTVTAVADLFERARYAGDAPELRRLRRALRGLRRGHY